MVSLALASVQTQREQEILAYRTRGNWQVLHAALDMTGTELYVLCAFSSWAFFCSHRVLHSLVAIVFCLWALFLSWEADLRYLTV